MPAIPIGGITLTSDRGYYNLPYRSQYNSYFWVSDILVCRNYIYVVHGNTYSLSQYHKNQDGTLGSNVRYYINWNSGYDGVFNEICRSNGSVPSCFTVYSDGVEDYVIGWSMDYARLIRWRINHSNGGIYDRTIFNVCPSACGTYSRAGWDGDRYIYFFNQANWKMYRWDIQNPNNALQEVCTMPSDYNLDSSYTGGGMLIRGNRAYWGDGANESNGLLGCFDLTTGALVGSVHTGAAHYNAGFYRINGDNGTIQFSPYHPGLAYYFALNYQRVQYLNVVSADFGGISVSTPIHHEDVDITFNVVRPTIGTAFGDTVGHRLLVNGVQVHPESGYTAITDKMPFRKSIYGIDNSHFNKVGRNSLVIELKDTNGFLVQHSVGVDVVNNQPVINAVAYPDTIHDESVLFDAVVTTEQTDQMSFRILLNGQVYRDWTPAVYSSPLAVRHIFQPGEFNIGSNTIRLEVKDNFKDSTTTSAQDVIVTKNNTVPTVTTEVRGHTLYIHVEDPEGDPVRFNVQFNGNQVTPDSGYSILFDTPLDVAVNLPKQHLIPGLENTVVVNAMDSAGDITTKTVKQIMNYAGLMFRDALGLYYTDDLGYLLKYLDMGEMRAREVSAVFQVWLENTAGYDIKNIKLTIDQWELDPVHEVVELSYTNDDTNPFSPESELFFPDPISTGETVTFFVRVNCDPEAVGGGRFKIKANGDPVTPV